MLTYAAGRSRHGRRSPGWSEQTDDKAQFQGQYYSDKLPGFPLLATLPYAIAKRVLASPGPSAQRPGSAYWAADYWITLGTSGVLTAGTAVLLVLAGHELGCRQRRAALIGLAYGLATPAYVYATLAYGHQATAFALFASFFLLWKKGRPAPVAAIVPRGFSRGLCGRDRASGRPGVGDPGLLSAGPVPSRRPAPGRPGAVCGGALIPTLILLVYNQLAFGSPWDMGYFHHATQEFAKVHNPDNPLGLKFPDEFWQEARQPALGPLPRARVLRADSAPCHSRMGRPAGSPVLGPGGR